MWTVTRQRQYPDGNLVVEISKGNHNYTNPGQLVKKYPGEGDEFIDPREAVNTAIAIAKAWQSSTKEEIEIAHGATGGMTLPFDGQPLADDTFMELTEWAERTYQKLPKCDHCGELVGKDKVCPPDYSDYEFCGTYCAEEFDRNNREEMEEAERTECEDCGEELDTDCNGQKRCPECDGPCPCCSDGG